MSADGSLAIRGLAKRWGRAPVLDGLDLTVRAGEVVALLGANGSGKTTLLRVAATLERPTRGSVRVAGCDTLTDADGARRALGFLGHTTRLYDELTARENLRFWTTLAGLARSATELERALAEADLAGAADTRVRTFSAGMRRRLGLVRLVFGLPAVLLLDEPYTGLDQAAASWLDGQLAEARRRGAATLLSTHSFGRGLAMADRVVVLAGGRIAADVVQASLAPGAVHELYARWAGDA